MNDENLCRCPKNTDCMRLFIQNINKVKWYPEISSKLCPIHFPEDVWQEMNDGKFQLKSQAIPEILQKTIDEESNIYASEQNSGLVPLVHCNNIINHTRIENLLEESTANVSSESNNVKNIDKSPISEMSSEESIINNNSQSGKNLNYIANETEVRLSKISKLVKKSERSTLVIILMSILIVICFHIIITYCLGCT